MPIFSFILPTFLFSLCPAASGASSIANAFPMPTMSCSRKFFSPRDLLQVIACRSLPHQPLSFLHSPLAVRLRPLLPPAPFLPIRSNQPATRRLAPRDLLHVVACGSLPNQLLSFLHSALAVRLRPLLPPAPFLPLPGYQPKTRRCLCPCHLRLLVPLAVGIGPLPGYQARPRGRLCPHRRRLLVALAVRLRPLRARFLSHSALHNHLRRLQLLLALQTRLPVRMRMVLRMRLRLPLTPRTVSTSLRVPTLLALSRL